MPLFQKGFPDFFLLKSCNCYNIFFLSWRYTPLCSALSSFVLLYKKYLFHLELLWLVYFIYALLALCTPPPPRRLVINVLKIAPVLLSFQLQCLAYSVSSLFVTVNKKKKKITRRLVDAEGS